MNPPPLQKYGSLSRVTKRTVEFGDFEYIFNQYKGWNKKYSPIVTIETPLKIFFSIICNKRKEKTKKNIFNQFWWLSYVMTVLCQDVLWNSSQSSYLTFWHGTFFWQLYIFLKFWHVTYYLNHLSPSVGCILSNLLRNLLSFPNE